MVDPENLGEFLKRAALVEIDAGNGVRFVALAPVFDETRIGLGDPAQATVTVTALAEGVDACLALVIGWRELQRQQIKAALQPEAVRH
jgi:hypothetical protein